MTLAIHLLFCFLSLFPAASFAAGRFTLTAAKSQDASQRGFIKEWSAAHQKWGKGVPAHAAAKLALADTDGQVRVQPLGSDSLYVATVGIGSPPQLVKVALDTGSADFWVQSTDTHYEYNRKGPWAPQYKPKNSESSTYVQRAQWDVSYADGTTAQGIIYQDSLSLGGFNISNATIQSAESVASQFETEVGLTGIMGLAKKLRPNVDPFMPSVLDLLRAQLPRPIFTADLRRNSTGRFQFGGADMDKFTWLDSNPSSPHWDVTLDLMAWEGGNHTWWRHQFTATVDTGTTLLFLPDVLASRYWFSIPGVRVDRDLTGAYSFPCSIAHKLPDLLFKLSGDTQQQQRVLTIPGAYLNYGPTAEDNATCWGGLQSSDELGTSILGDAMLKALLVAFDIEKQRVGFANKVLDEDNDDMVVKHTKTGGGAGGQ